LRGNREDRADVAERGQVVEAAAKRGESVRQHRYVALLSFHLFQVVEATDDLEGLLQHEEKVARQERIDAERIAERLAPLRAEVADEGSLEGGIDERWSGAVVEQRGEIVRDRCKQRVLKIDDADPFVADEEIPAVIVAMRERQRTSRQLLGDLPEAAP